MGFYGAAHLGVGTSPKAGTADDDDIHRARPGRPSECLANDALDPVSVDGTGQSFARNREPEPGFQMRGVKHGRTPGRRCKETISTAPRLAQSPLEVGTAQQAPRAGKPRCGMR